MIEINDLQAGKAGEYLVCADLILRGCVAYPSEQGLSYDVVVDVQGKLIRIQVKTTRQPKSVPQRREHTPAYIFHIRRMGNGGRRAYSDKDVDLFALVALDTKTIGYIAEQDAAQTMICRIDEHKGSYYDERSRGRRGEIIEMRKEGYSFNEIARQMNLDKSYVHRVYQGIHGVQEVGVYLSQLNFDDALSKVLNK